MPSRERRSTVELEGSLARFAADEGEAQERKGLRFAEPASLAVDRRKAAELNQAGLVRVERQRKFPEPFAHRVKETACVAFTLEADDQIVRVTNDDHDALSLPPSPALSPEIETVMQVDVGKERRDHRTLSRSPVIDRHDPIFEDARLEPLLDQADDALVADPMFQEANQPILADRPEEVLDVGVKYPVHFPYFDRRRQRVQRIVRPSPGSEPVRETAEVAFVDSVERHDGCALYDLVFQGGDRERPLLPIGLRYVRPARRLRSIGSPVDPSVQILDPGFEVRLVVTPRYAIDAGGGFALKRVKRRPERVGIEVVEERGELSLLPLPCGFAVSGPAPGSRAPGSVSGACFADPRSPWSPALAPPAPQPVARLCSSASRLLCRSLTSLDRASAATAPHLPATDHATQ